MPLQWDYNSFQHDSFGCWRDWTSQGILLSASDYQKKVISCENGRKEKKSTENGRVEQAQYRVESNKALSLVYVKNFNLTMTIPQLLKIFSILSMVPQFSQNITAVWVGPIIYSQAKTKHCLRVFWPKSIAFSQIQPQKRQSTETPVCSRY